MNKKKVVENSEPSIPKIIEDPFLSDPTIFFEKDEEVDVGNLEDCRIVDFRDDRKYYLVSHFSQHRNERIFGNSWFSWTHISKKECKDTKFSEKYESGLYFHQESISSLIIKSQCFGIESDVDYQRDYVWDLEDKQELIHSIFQGIDIGKFVFVERKITSVEKSYEILDGKQRLNAIMEFYENRFKFKDVYFYELSKKDKNVFRNHSISSAVVKENITEKQKLNLFVRLNSFGKVMSKEHLEKVKEMMKEI